MASESNNVTSLLTATDTSGAEQAMPKTLYRYRGYDPKLTFDRDLFLNHGLWFSAPRDFNDPFEARPVFSWDDGSGTFSDAHLRKAVEVLAAGKSAEEKERQFALTKAAVATDEKRALYRDLNHKFREVFHKASLCCFSESPSSIPMWSYYASGHRGYCVGFSLPQAWPYTLDDGKDAWLPVWQVRYRREYPTLEIGYGGVGPDGAENLPNGLLTKARCWRHEREWRAIRGFTKPGLQPFPPDALRVVILGAAMPVDQKEKMKELLRFRGIKVNLYEAFVEIGKFRVRKLRVPY